MGRTHLQNVQKSRFPLPWRAKRGRRNNDGPPAATHLHPTAPAPRCFVRSLHWRTRCARRAAAAAAAAAGSRPQSTTRQVKAPPRAMLRPPQCLAAAAVHVQMCTSSVCIQNAGQRGRSGCTARTPAAQPQNELHDPRCSRPRCGRCAPALDAPAPAPHVHMHDTAPVLRGHGVASAQRPKPPTVHLAFWPRLQPAVRARGTRCCAASRVLYSATRCTTRTARVQVRHSAPTPPTRPPGKCLDECQLAGGCVCPWPACRAVPMRGLYVTWNAVLHAMQRR